MKRIFLIAALFALPTTTAFAAITTDSLVSGYQAEGYTTIEVTQGVTQTKVEAIKDSAKIEVVYDTETGNVLSTETGSVSADDDVRPGVSVRTKDRDFVGSSSGDDDTDDDSNDDSNDDGDDNSGDDDGSTDGDDNGSGDDSDSGDDSGSGDDHGSDHDSDGESDHDSDHDSGGDSDHGSDHD